MDATCTGRTDLSLKDRSGEVNRWADRRRSPRLPGAASAAVCASLTFFPAEAVDLVPPEPWEVIHVAREFGPAEVARDGMKDPQIRGTIDGLQYRVTFYGCQLGRDCDTILFDARFPRNEEADKSPPTQFFVEWNRRKLFGRAWLDEQNRAVLDHPVALGEGVPKSALRLTFESWARALAEYADHLGFR